MLPHALNPTLLRRTDEVGLSQRTVACLTTANIMHVGELVQMIEVELLRTPHIGVTALKEIKTMLGGLGLHLGMEVPGWPPEDLTR